MANETPVLTSLAMDRSDPIGNSPDNFLRRALHVKVGNKTTEPIPVSISSSTPSVTDAVYDEAQSVPANTLTDILTYVVPTGRQFVLTRAVAAGNNIVEYTVTADTLVIGKQWTYFAGDFTTVFEFSDQGGAGYLFPEGTTLKVDVKHTRPTNGDFSARMMGHLI